MKNILNFILLAIVVVGFAILMNGCICTNTPPTEQSWWEYQENWGADGHGNWPLYAYIAIIFMYPFVWLFI